MQDDTDLDESEGIDDPEALRRAEERAAHAEELEPPEPWMPAGTLWVPVAVAMRDCGWALADLRAALREENIPSRYDPFDPRQQFMMPYTLTRLFSVVVPETCAARGREISGEMVNNGSPWSVPVEGAR